MNEELRIRLLGSAAIETLVDQAGRLIELTSFIDAGDVDRLTAATGLLHEVLLKASVLASLPTSAETAKPEEQVVQFTIIESALRQSIGRDPNPGDLRAAAAIGYPKYVVGQPVRVTAESGNTQVRTVQRVDHLIGENGEFYWGYGFGGDASLYSERAIEPVPQS